MVKMHVFNERQLCKQIIFTEGCRNLKIPIDAYDNFYISSNMLNFTELGNLIFFKF